MDTTHRDELIAAGADPARVRMFRDFDPVDPGADVPDPYYGGADGFEEVLAMVERTSEALARPLGPTASPSRTAAVTRQPRSPGVPRPSSARPWSRPRRPPAATSPPPPSSGCRDGTTALMKTHPHAPEGFFEVEAAGLRWLAEARRRRGRCPRGARVDHDCLILRWIEPGKLTVDAAAAFGTALAATHAAGAPAHGACRRSAPQQTGTLRPSRTTASSAGSRCPAARRRPGRSSSRPGGCCPTSSWPATAATPQKGTPMSSRPWWAGSATWCPRSPGPAARRPLERQRRLGCRGAWSA